MRIGVDALILNEKNTGIGKYTIKVLNKICEHSNHQIFLFSSSKYELKEFFNEDIEIIKLPLSSKNKYLRILNEHLILPIIARRYDLDLFFCPFYTSPTLSKIKKIVVVYDMIYKNNYANDTFLRNLYRQIFFTGSIKKADKIITISEYTKNDILKHFPNLSNIHVTYLGTIDYVNKHKSRPETINKNDKFLLTVGSITPRKNNIRTIKAFESLNNENLKIVIAGDVVPGQSEEVLEYIKKNNLSDRVIVTGYISDEELAWCYENAEILMYCSLFEGFGLPPFESMQSGTPVIASNTTSIPEVLGDSALLVDPYNIQEIASSIERILNNKEFKNHLIEKGYKHYKKFNWDTTAKQTIEILESF